MSTISPIKNLLTVFMLSILLTGCEAFSGRETAGEYLDDTTITTKVKAQILGDTSLSPFQISVETFRNVVQLSGFVDSSVAAARAGKLAAQTEGVKSVRNNLVVRKK
jgi:hyperosmotically inducible protein